MWCGGCQDHFTEYHYAHDGHHKRGYKYGPLGFQLKELDILNKVIDTAIDDWHRQDYPHLLELELHEHLGLTWQEYSEWVTKRDIV